jgi:hypothetical protein
MKTLHNCPEISHLAAKLGVSPADNPQGIVDWCLERVTGWVQEAGGVQSSGQLEALICQKLATSVEEIHSEADFDRLGAKFALMGRDLVFAGLKSVFRPSVFGALIRRSNAHVDDSGKYVAVIDCRGAKANRSWFTKWHELAHRLTTHADEPVIVFREAQSLIENLVDEVASRIGFYPPLLKKALAEANEGKERLTFALVEKVREFFAGASFHATLLACVREFSGPVTYVEVISAEDGPEITRLFSSAATLPTVDFDFVTCQGGDLDQLLRSADFNQVVNVFPEGVFEGKKVPDRAYGIFSWGVTP